MENQRSPSRLSQACLLLLGVCISLHGREGLAQQLPTEPQSSAAARPITSGAEQDLSPQPAPAVVDDPIAQLAQTVSQRLEQVQADATILPGDAKDSLVKGYQQILADLGVATTAKAQQAKWDQMAAAAPETLKSTRERIEEMKRDKAQAVPEFTNLDEGQAALQSLEAELAAATQKTTQLKDSETTREKRRKELPTQISELRTRLEQLANQPPGTTVDDPLNGELVQWSNDAARRTLSQQILALESEQRAYNAESSLLPAQIELAQANEARAKEQVRQVNEALTALRSDRIFQHELEVRGFLGNDMPESFDQKTEALLARIDQWKQLAADQVYMSDVIESDKTVLADWKEQRTKMQTRVDTGAGAEGVAAFNSWVGLMLRKQRGELPDSGKLTAEIHRLQDKIRQADLLLFELEDSLRDIRTAPSAIDEEVGNEGTPTLGAAERRQRQLLLKTEEILSAMKLDVDAYLDELIEAADIKQNTIALASDYREFINKHILWIRSCDRLQREDVEPAGEALRWLASLDRWKSTSRLLTRDVLRSLGWYLLFIIGMLVLLLNQSTMRRRLAMISDKAAKNSCIDFSLTSQGLLLTLLVSAPAPVILLFACWRLTAASNVAIGMGSDTDFVRALAHGLLMASAVFLPMELLRQISRPKGLGVKHFGWTEKTARWLGSNLRWLINCAVPPIALMGILSAQSRDPRWETSLGRMLFILLMPLLSLFFTRLFQPSKGIFREYLARHRGGWIDRTRLLWYPAIVLSPFVVASTSFVGYHYTAQRIAFHFNSTLWMAVVLTIVYCLLARWLLLNRRKLMIAQARARLEEAARREPGVAKGPTEEPALSMVDLNEQTKRLVTSIVVASGLIAAYVIWSDVLPAVSMLDRFALWSVQGNTPEETITITLANLVLIVPIVILVFISARNAPGLLEIAFLQHLPLTNAAKYAITTMFSYAIISLGIVAVSSTIGLRWSSIQWLVAALGVGLGFGLQEIFANFVSGIVLLFEQPLRVGDMITVDGTTGTVTKIRMRATTIVNWDRQEFIIPNKDLITGKLLNWTLTDSTNRVVLTVGVAYGSDMVQACELVRKICEDHESIMTEPVPRITFEGFGDNALNIVVRVYLQSLDQRLSTIHDLHQRIYQAFGKAGIEIAFPQRDLHIRSLPEKLVQWFEKQKEK